jgi:hypothetical protein
MPIAPGSPPFTCYVVLTGQAVSEAKEHLNCQNRPVSLVEQVSQARIPDKII